MSQAPEGMVALRGRDANLWGEYKKEEKKIEEFVGAKTKDGNESKEESLSLASPINDVVLEDDAVFVSWISFGYRDEEGNGGYSESGVAGF
ncbi:hypothetical protein OIU78_029333 [Salix suchowensis]|nr:hypothetical protein OIU78_029333 [Salix suchowensis]